MAKTESFLLKKLSGQIAKELVFKQYGDKTVVTKYPDMSKRKFSPNQLRIQNVMEEANLKASEVMADEQLRNEAQVRLNVTRNQLYRALIREHFKSAQAGK